MNDTSPQLSKKFYLNIYFNRHAKGDGQYFCKAFSDPDKAKNDGDSYFGYISTLELPEKMIEFFKSRDESLLKG